MQQQGLRHIAVLCDGMPVGVISEMTLWRATPSSLPVLLRYEWTSALDRVQARDIMTKHVHTLPPYAPVRQAAQLLATAPTECVLVLDTGCLVGLVTLEELLDVLLHQMEAQGPVRYERIVVCTAEQTVASAALRTALALARQHTAHLTVLQVLPSLSATMPIDLEHVSVEMVMACHEDRQATTLARLAASLPGDTEVTVDCQVVEGEPWVAVVKISAKLAADLIIIESKQRWRVRARSSRHQAQMVVRYAPCPVLLVEEE